MKTYTTILFSIFMLFGFVGQVQAQFSIDDLNIAFSEDFDGFDGSGFDSSPTAGQLDSDSWRITGMSDGDGTFGGTHNGGDFARGSGLSTGGVSTGGLYGFDGGGGITIVGVQPTGSDFAPGEITLRVQNNTDAEITDLDISYDIYVYNNEGRSSSFNFAHSDDDVTYTDIGALNYTTPEAADGSPTWTQINRSTSITGLSIGIGEFYYLQWKSDDVGGSGSRDEFGLTNLSITADGTVVEDPTIVASLFSLTGFEYAEGNGPSDEQSFTASGINLEGNITITPPTNYEISTGTGGSFVPTNPITLTESGGEVSETPIYVRLKEGLSESSYNNENIQLTSTNADQVNVTASGEVLEDIFLIYDFDSNSISPRQSPPNSTTSDFQITSGSISFGSTSESDWVNAGSAVPHAQGSNWSAGTADAAKNFFFTIDPDLSYGINLTNISFNYYATGSGASNITVEINGDEIDNLIGISSGEVLAFNEVLTGFEDLNSVEVRIKGWGGSSGDFRVDDVRLDGSMVEDIYFRQITGNAGWRMLSLPITGGTVEDISDNTAIQGVTGGDNEGFDSNFSTYDDSGVFETPANVSTAIGDGYGFITYFFDNNEAGSSELPITLDVSGTEPGSDVTVDLNSFGDFTLVGNPFGSNYDLNEMTSDGTIQTNVHFWDNATSSYDPIDHTSFIASTWQGFWVESSDGTELTFPTSGKTTSASTETYFSKENNEIAKADINFTLSSEKTFDKAIRLSLREDAEMGWDLDDASKFVPLVPQGTPYATMAFVGEENLQSVFSIPFDLEGSHSFDLQETLSGVSGEFAFSWSGMESIPNAWEITLHDYETGQSLNMREVESYVFEDEETAAKKVNSLSVLKSPAAQIQKAKSNDSPRFGITILAGEAVSTEASNTPQKFTLDQNYPNPFNPTTNIEYSVSESGNVNLMIYNVMGQRVATLVSETKSTGTYRVHWDASGMASGIYYYRLQSAGQVLTRQMTLIK